MEIVSFPLIPFSASLTFWGAVVPQAVFMENNSEQGETTIPKLHQGVGFEKLFRWCFPSSCSSLRFKALIVEGIPVPWLHSLPVLGLDPAPQGAPGSQPRREAAWMLIVFVRAAGLRAQWLSLLTEPPL